MKTVDLICAALVLVWLAAMLALTVGVAGAGAAAWVQAIGSVLAIFAAIWIDQGAARRASASIDAARQDRMTAVADRVADWQRAVRDSVEALENISRAAPVHGDPNQFEPEDLARIVGNQEGLLTVMLAFEPPNPSLGWVMIAVRTELGAAATAIRNFKRGSITAHLDMPIALQLAATAARAALNEYQGGVH